MPSLYASSPVTILLRSQIPLEEGQYPSLILFLNMCVQVDMRRPRYDPHLLRLTGLLVHPPRLFEGRMLIFLPDDEQLGSRHPAHMVDRAQLFGPDTQPRLQLE